MSTATWAWLVLAFPLAGMLVVGFGFRALWGRGAGWIGTGAVLLSFVPEILDFVGWGAIVALLGMMAWWVVPFIPAFNANQTALSLNTALAAKGKP